MKKSLTSSKDAGGISVSKVAIPLLSVISVSLIAVFLFVFGINQASATLTDLVNSFANYKLDAISLQGGNIILAETCNSYIQVPTVGNGQPNVGPIAAYLEQTKKNNMPVKVEERFKADNVSKETYSYIKQATDYSLQMMETQFHAISLVKSVYPLPNTIDISSIKDVKLTESELAMSAKKRIDKAKSLLVAKEYTSLRYYVSECVEKCNYVLSQDFEKAYSVIRVRTTVMKLFLGFFGFVLVGSLASAFVMFYKYIVKPVRRYSNSIDEGKKIDNVKAVAELCQVAEAYNVQLARRNKLEGVLHKAAKIDTLTGLPNRYSMENDVVETDINGKPLGVVLFDINYLKKTNDTKGHMAGDQLIRNTAYCIRQCFSNGNNNCYRIGGDEFVALMLDCNQDEIENRIEHFKLITEREKITVSAGYAYDENADDNSFRILLEKADKQMYEQKRIIHERDNNSVSTDV